MNPCSGTPQVRKSRKVDGEQVFKGMSKRTLLEQGGGTPNGDRLVGEAEFSHEIPAGAQIATPRPCSPTNWRLSC